MGILIMKLQEYRMTSGKMNSDLKHVTVLEEAHNLLRRTSTEQMSESANLLGKSVEMLANAIAEMRTYGEGFIIADQSPGLLDLSVIRNTNTKIKLHLPEKDDRELAGKAASLNDDQIEELAKLQCGVAAVYQNNWLQGVLCKVDEFTDYDKNYRYEKADHTALDKAKDIGNLKRLAITDLKKMSIKEVVEKIDFTDFKAIKAETIVSLFSNSDEVVDAAHLKAKEQRTGLHGFYDYLVEHLEPNIDNLSSEYRNFILCCIIDEKCRNDISKREIPSLWQRFIEKEVR
jgi:DNA helicase HerA-like ATPase